MEAESVKQSDPETAADQIAATAKRLGVQESRLRSLVNAALQSGTTVEDLKRFERETANGGAPSDKGLSDFFPGIIGPPNSGAMWKLSKKV